MALAISDSEQGDERFGDIDIINKLDGMLCPPIKYRIAI